MLSKPFLAKCEDRRQLPKLHPSGSAPEDWYDNELLMQNGLFGISFDFFVNWSAKPSCISPVIWIKRLVKIEYTYSDVVNDLDNVMTTEFGLNYLQRLIGFATAYHLQVQFVLFRDDYKWADETNNVLLITMSKNESNTLNFSHSEIPLSQFKKMIQYHSGGPVKMGMKGLFYGTSFLECFLSKTDSLYSGDVDLLLLNESNDPVAIVEFKKHGEAHSINEENLSRYYDRDRRKYDRLTILRDHLSKDKNRLPVLIIFYPTQPHITQGRMELVGGEPGRLTSILASNFNLPANNSAEQIIPVIHKTIKAVKWYHSDRTTIASAVVKRLNVEQDLISRVEEYLKEHNLANRGIEDGDYEKQRIGMIGELTVYNYLFSRYPDLDLKQDGFDGGYDIAYNNKLIDVKTMGRKSFVQPGFVNNFYLLQSHHKADTIIFCSYHTVENILEICGWIPKDELTDRGIYYAAGTRRLRTDGSSFIFRQNNYEVENKDLNDITLLKISEKRYAEDK